MARLPIWQHSDAIVQKVLHNRVTLVLGQTGCGKSTQIPQMLHKHVGGAILCTQVPYIVMSKSYVMCAKTIVQPRRLAVVSIAERVAAEMGSVVGATVGYHIGQRKCHKDDSSIVFVTVSLFYALRQCFRSVRTLTTIPFRLVYCLNA